jgi:serine/threonine-protein kinase
MGEVYRATDSVLDRTVAIKLLAHRHARDPDVRARFKREALAAAQLSTQKHVVTVFDVGEHAGRPFIVMEYLEGGSVHDRLRRGAVEPARALEWLEGAAEALDAAHQRGIVHRDVKPANLLLDAADSVHVSDFGIASAAGFDTITIPGTVLGTAGYMAPEQARGESATAATDRYALGVVAFELLTGRRPFAADTPVTEALSHLNAEVPSATRLEPALPASVDTVFERALAKDPSERPLSSRALVAGLGDALDAGGGPTLVHPPPPPSSRTPPRRYERRRGRVPAYALLALGLLVVGLAGAALVAMLDDGSPRRTATETRSPAASDTNTGADTTTATPPPAPEPPPAPSVDVETLANAGYFRMRDRDFEGALPLLEQAVNTLRGTGSLLEAYASYNLANTRFALGRCDGVAELLDRSEAVQGDRKEIDKLRRQVERDCFGERGNGKDKDDD